MRGDIVQLGNIIYGEYRSGFAGNVIGVGGVCFSLTTNTGGYREPLVVIEYED